MTASLRSKGPRCQNSGISPLIAKILANEDYYGDGPPTWLNARSSKHAKEARKSSIKRLRHFASQFPETKALAKTLARCKPRRRCMSGSCPECRRAFQRWFVAQVVDLAGNADPDDLNSASIIFEKHRTAGDQLNTLAITGMKRSISEIIKNTDDLGWMAGGIDLSLNDDTQKNQGIFWQPQLYAICCADVSNLSKVLRERFKSTEATHRPVQIKSCDGTKAAVSYAFKTEFVRRIAYWGKSASSQNPRESWHTRKVSLRAVEHVQAMLWMHKIGLAGRLFLRGVRMTRNGDGVGLAKIKKLE